MSLPFDRRHSLRMTTSSRPALLATMLLLLVAGSGTAYATVLSFSESAVPVGDNPQSFSVSHCNGDGVPDVIAAGFDANSVSIFVNAGAGELTHDATVATPPQPGGAACGDFTGDGLSDFAVSSWAQGTVTAFRATETGGFEPVATIPVGSQASSQPRAVLSDDINLDGKLDLVVVNAGTSDLTLLFGNGAGGFPTAANIRLPSENQSNRPRAAAVADFNQDGFPDIAVASQGAPSLRLLLGDGLGFHFFEGSLPILGPLIGIAAGDLDDDGIPDLALLSAEAAVSLYTGNGDGTFAFRNRIPVRTASKAVGMADFDQDGLLDLALSYSDANAVQVIRALAPGIFPGCGRADSEPFECPVSPSINGIGNVQSRVLDDINQLLFVDPAAQSIRLLQMETLGALTVTSLHSLDATPQALYLTDLDGDDVRDAVVVTSQRRSTGLHILPGMSEGSFGAAHTGSAVCGDGILEGAELCDDGNTAKKDGCSPSCQPEIDRGLLFLEAADIDRDGMRDLVVVDGRGSLRVLFGDGNRRFRRVATLTTVKRKTGAAVGDFTGDAAPDIVFLPKRSRDGRLVLLVNDGLGGFTTTHLAADERRARFAGPLLAGDVDRNGFADLIILRASKPKGVTIYYGDAQGPLRTPVTTEVPRGVVEMAAADFNEDGWLDVIARFKSRRRLPMLLFGSPNGGLLPGPFVPVADGRTSWTVADVDEDLHADLVACGAGAPGVCRILYGDGRGAFFDLPLPASPSIGREVRGAGTGDFDGDGHVDLAGVSRRDSRGIVHFGGPNPTTMLLETGTKPGALEVADLNNDGREDLVVANEGSQDVSVFTNAGTPANPRRFNTLARIKLPVGGSGPVALAVADANGDQLLDVAVSQGIGGRVTLLLNTAGAGLAPQLPNLETGAMPRGVALGNMNGDARHDIVTANHDADTLSVFLSTPEGGYQRTDIPSGGNQPWDVEAPDMDGDGLDDLVVINGLSGPGALEGSVVTLINQGDGTFAAVAPAVVHGRETPTTMCVGDFDGDDALDVAIGSIGTADISILHGDGNGGWTGDRRCIAAGEPVSAVSCNDADRDGLTDVAFGRRRGSDVGAVLTGLAP